MRRTISIFVLFAMMICLICGCSSSGQGGNGESLNQSESASPTDTPQPTPVPTPKPTPKPTPEPTPHPDLSFMDGTWRDEVYREGNSSVQFEVIIDTVAGTVSINSITENARTVMSNGMKIDEYGQNYISAGGYVFTYLDGDLLDVNSALFTNPPLTRFSYGTGNDAFGSDQSDYRKSNSFGSQTTSVYLSEDMKGALWALAEKAVKNELKSPSTAKFPSSYGSDGVSFGKSGDLYTVSAWVDAQNGFGATVRTNFTVYAYLEGTTVKLDHVFIDE